MNILPKKSWHVFKPENVEKVLKDEAAAREQEALRFDAELEAKKDLRKSRLRLMQKGVPAESQGQISAGGEEVTAKESKLPSSGHLNLFEGADFDIGSKAREVDNFGCLALAPEIPACRRKPAILRGS